MRRYDALQAIAPGLTDELVIANLANTTTEWRALRPHDGTLYFVGMGMVTPYALGLALALPQRRVLALDGDGGLLFDLAALGTLAQTAPPNLCVVVLDNEGYVSTGPWASVPSLTAGPVDLEAVARGAGLKQVWTVREVRDFKAAVETGLRSGAGPTLIVAKVDRGQAFVGTTPIDARENKYRFVRHVEQREGRVILKPSAKEHGAPAPPDAASAAVGAGDRFASVLHDGLAENGVDFVVGLPSSGLAHAQELCLRDPAMRYVGVAHEGTGLGLCAGAWLGGKRPAALFENLGMMAGAYHLLRGHATFGIPTLLVLEFRGDAGDQEFWAECGELTEPMLAAMRVNHRVVRGLGELKPAIRDGLRWMTFALRPFAVLPAFDLTRPRA
jgi:sulfopyruvate decarboxylase TPP-binding subunit